MNRLRREQVVSVEWEWADPAGRAESFKQALAEWAEWADPAGLAALAGLAKWAVRMPECNASAANQRLGRGIGLA
jgi:hypothetical protein